MTNKENSKSRINTKYVHITLQKLENSDKNYWVTKAREFRANVVAVLMGVEEIMQKVKGCMRIYLCNSVQGKCYQGGSL